MSFTNGLDGARRRRLFALDSWDLNNFSLDERQPGSADVQYERDDGNVTQTLAAVPTNSRFTPGTNGGSQSAGLLRRRGWPSGTRRSTSIIRCRFPTIPTSRCGRNGSTTRISFSSRCCRPRRWTRPRSWRQLSQYVINIVDFRDTGQHDDALGEPGRADCGGSECRVDRSAGPADSAADHTPSCRCRHAHLAGYAVATPPTIAGWARQPASDHDRAARPVRDGIQPGGDQRGAGVLVRLQHDGGRARATRANRFFVELVNTQTSPEISAATTRRDSTRCSTWAGIVYNVPTRGRVRWIRIRTAPWDIIFTADDPYSRPDPYRGQLIPYANTLRGDAAGPVDLQPAGRRCLADEPEQPRYVRTPPGTPADGYDVMLQPLGSRGATQSPPRAPADLRSPTRPLHELARRDVAVADQLFLRDWQLAAAGGVRMRSGTPGPNTDDRRERGRATVDDRVMHFGDVHDLNVPTTSHCRRRSSRSRPTMDPVTGTAARR